MTEERPWWHGLVDPRFIVSLLLIALFSYAYFDESDKDTRNLMVGAMIAAFAGAWGYWLGSSNTSHKGGERLDRALGIAEQALPTPDQPQEVKVVNPPEEPAIVTEAEPKKDDDAGLPEFLQ